MTAFDIGDRKVGPDESTYIIAEAGSNHNGDLDTAKELIDVAADAGADAVKFQTFRAEDLYVDDRDMVDDPDESTYTFLESLEKPYEWIPELYKHSQSRDIHFMSSPFDESSAQKLAEYVPAFKVASFTLSHHPFLEELAEFGKPIIMSTGAHKQSEVEEAVSVLRENGVEDLVLLHCVSSYPTPLNEINVRAVRSLGQEFDTIVGFSDHTIEPSVAPSAAVTLGASIVEKHFTLDKTMDGPDHSFALEPNELEEMVNTIRNTEQALGDGSLSVRDIERETYERSRRGIHAATGIEKGQTITSGDVQIIRPGEVVELGGEPKFLDKIVGSTATVDIDPDEGVSTEMVED